MTRHASQRDPRASGFTLIEILVVLGIAGLIMTLTVMRIDHMSPKYALRAAARKVGGTIDLARGVAAGRGFRTAIEYDIDNRTYRVYQEPRDGSRGPGPFGFEPAGAAFTLPRGVGFRELIHGNGDQKGRGVWAIGFEPLSIDGSHIVVLENEEKKQISVKYNALLGSCDYQDGTAQFEAPQD